MNSPNDKRHATASAGELDEYVAQLPASRGRLHTFIGVAPAPPIVTGRPESIPPSDHAPVPASAPVSVAASQPSPVSHVRAKAEPRPELPRVMAASKHTFDAVSINTDPVPLVVAPAPKRRGRGRVVLLASLAAAAALALVAGRRAPQLAPRLAAQVVAHVRPALTPEPPFTSSIDLPEVSPVVLAATATAERAVPSAISPAPRSHRHRHAPKRIPAPLDASN